MTTPVVFSIAFLSGIASSEVKSLAGRTYRSRISIPAVRFDETGRGRIVFLPMGANLCVIGPSSYLVGGVEVEFEKRAYNIFEIDVLTRAALICEPTRAKVLVMAASASEITWQTAIDATLRPARVRHAIPTLFFAPSVSSPVMRQNSSRGKHMFDGGRQLKLARLDQSLTYHDVEHLSRTLAETDSNDRYTVRTSVLIGIETLGAVPSILHLRSLCLIYEVELPTVLRWLNELGFRVPAHQATSGALKQANA